jgi:MFS family permease
MNSAVSYRDLLQQRDFRWLWAGQVISNLGNNFSYLALSVLAYRVTGSALSVGLMLAATTLPVLLIRPLAGVLVDRGDRQRIMIASDLVRALLIAAVPTLAQFHLGWVYGLAFLSSVAAQFFRPAFQSVIPDLVDEGALMAANALHQSSQKLTEVVGFALAGLVATTIALPLVFYFDALTFVISAVCIAVISVPRVPLDSSANQTVSESLLEGLRFIRRDRVLSANLAIAGVAPIPPGALAALLLVFTIHALRSDPFGYGLLESAMGLGVVLGGLILGKQANRFPPGQLFGLSLAGMGLAILVLSRLDTLILALVLIFLFGILDIASYLVPLWLVQRQTPSEFRGRVLSVWGLTIQAAFLVGMIGGSALADLLDVRTVLAGAGIWLVGVGFVTRSLLRDQ